MGNLLGSPITEKDTHVGRTHHHPADSDDNMEDLGLDYGISSMQGWRIHMEDAHIAQPFLYAEKMAPVVGKVVDCAQLNSNAINGDTEGTPAVINSNYTRIPLPNHSLFAVFDGHGGSFAAEYASRNLLRVLSRQPAFCAYAERWRRREDYFATLKRGDHEDRSVLAGSTEEKQEMLGENSDDRQRLGRLLERGRESDEKVKQIKEMVRRHLDGEDVELGDKESDTIAEQSTQGEGEGGSSPHNISLEVAKAAYDQELMTLLEYALRDAFCDVDAEILREVRGLGNADANTPYGRGYCLHDAEGVGHLPKEADLEEEGMLKVNPDHNRAVAADEKPPPGLHDEDSGTTAIVVLLTPKWIVCANAGDSRAIYSRSNHRSVPLSYDHKPDDEDEERRIREAGGYVSGGRVEGDLAVSRGLGDFRFKEIDVVMSGSAGENRDRRNIILDIKNNVVVKENNDATPLDTRKPGDQKVSPVPDIIVQNRDEKEDEFIVIACDGIWDVQTNQECVQMVAEIFAEGESDVGLVCEEILDLCLIKGSKDNMTAAVIKFPKQSIGSGGGVIARRERRGANESEDGEQSVKYLGLRRSPTPNPYVPRGASDTDESDGKPL